MHYQHVQVTLTRWGSPIPMFMTYGLKAKLGLSIDADPSLYFTADHHTVCVRCGQHYMLTISLRTRLPSPSSEPSYHQTCTATDLHRMMCDSLLAQISRRPSWVSLNCLVTPLGGDPCSLFLLSVTQHISPMYKHCLLIQESC